MADYPDRSLGPDVRPGMQTPNVRPTPTPDTGLPLQSAQRSTLGPAIAAAAVVIVVGLVAWNVLGGPDVPVTPAQVSAPISETTAPDSSPDTSPGVVPAPTPPEAAPQPAPDVTPGNPPAGDPATDLPPVGDPPAAPETGTGTTTTP